MAGYDVQLTHVTVSKRIRRERQVDVINEQLRVTRFLNIGSMQ